MGNIWKLESTYLPRPHQDQNNSDFLSRPYRLPTSHSLACFLSWGTFSPLSYAPDHSEWLSKTFTNVAGPFRPKNSFFFFAARPPKEPAAARVKGLVIAEQLTTGLVDLAITTYDSCCLCFSSPPSCCSCPEAVAAVINGQERYQSMYYWCRCVATVRKERLWSIR